MFSQLDHDRAVTRYTPEPCEISYEYKGRVRTYVPDILVEYEDGSKQLVEVKPIYDVGTPRNVSKFEAAKKYAEQHGYKFVVHVVRGVGYLSYHLHTIEKKYERWEDAKQDWDVFLARRESQKKAAEASSSLADVVKSLIFVAVIIYTVVELLRSCRVIK